MIQLNYVYTRTINLPGIILSALTNPCQNAKAFTSSISPLLTKGFSNNWDDLCGFAGYKILIHLSEAKVNKDFVTGLASECIAWELAKDGHGEFPYHASICCRNKDARLYFCISYEPCSPNWNKEQKLVKAIPLANIDVPLIEDESGIRKMDKTVLQYLQFIEHPKIAFPDYGKQPTKEQLTELINMGMKCYYRHGWAYRGAAEREISKEKALELLPQYSYGMGFYELKFGNKFGEPVLEFNELGENDLL